MIDPDAITTKDSGERAAFSNGGVRDTQAGKPRFDLIFPLNVPYKNQLITRLAALMGRGAEKYDDRNWEQFSDKAALERAKSSAVRHLIQWLNGEEDEDHGPAVIFNIMVADYVQGVLDGQWDPIQAEQLDKSETGEPELWKGASTDEAPPIHVHTLRLVHPERDSGYYLIRAKDTRWYWSRSSEPSTQTHKERGDFAWFTVTLPYKFEEVR